MTKEILITSNAIKELFNRFRAAELTPLVYAIEQAGARHNLIGLMDMVSLPDPLPHIAFNLTSWPHDTHLNYMRGLEIAGVKVINTAYGSRIANDKMLTYHELTGVVPQPQTLHWDTRYINDWTKTGIQLLDQIGMPCVIKISCGAKSTGVYKVDSVDQLEDLLHIVAQTTARNDNGQAGVNVLVQKLVPDTQSKVVRVIVVGNQCLGAMLRYNTQHWKTGRPNSVPTFSTAGVERREKYPMDTDLQSKSLAVCGALNLEYAAVDFFITADGYVFNEIGTSPDTPAFDACNNISVYQHLVQYMLNHE